MFNSISLPRGGKYSRGMSARFRRQFAESQICPLAPTDIQAQVGEGGRKQGTPRGYNPTHEKNIGGGTLLRVLVLKPTA